MTKEGLRIELIETGRGDVFFALGSAQMKTAAVIALQAIAPELRRCRTPSSSRGTPTPRASARRRVHELGAVGRARERGAPRARRRRGCPRDAGGRGARARGPPSARRDAPARPVEPPHLDPAALPRPRRGCADARRHDAGAGGAQHRADRDGGRDRGGERAARADAARVSARDDRRWRALGRCPTFAASFPGMPCTPPPTTTSPPASSRTATRSSARSAAAASATVYLARDRKHDRHVAVKVMRAGARARPWAPSGSCARSRSPRGCSTRTSCRVLDSGAGRRRCCASSRRSWTARALRDRLRARCSSRSTTAVAIAREVADALEFAHAARR